MIATLDLTIRRLPDASHVADLRVDLPQSRADLAASLSLKINTTALTALSALPEAYGAALTAMVLPVALQSAWERARGFTEGAGTGLNVRIMLDDPSGELHSLRWELLRDPRTNLPLACQEGGSLARLVTVDLLHNGPSLSRPTLHALIAVAGPRDAAAYQLAPVDVHGEAARALGALGAIRPTLLASGHPQSRGSASLARICDGLRAGAQVLYLICHGRVGEAGTTLYLEDELGLAAPISGGDLAAALGALAAAHRPLLVVLVACVGNDPLASVGMLLARTGLPAVVAMQGDISMAAAARFTSRLLGELARDGRIDQALAAARREMGEEWWVPVLWLRPRDGRLWAEEALDQAQPSRGGGVTIGGSVGTMQVINVTGGGVGSIIGSQHTYGPSSASSPGHDPIDALRQRLVSQRGTLAHYLNQLAIAGAANVRPEVTAGIREARSAIRQLKAQLRSVGAAVDDQSDDEG